MTQNANYALQYFVKNGWTPEQAAGIVGNLMQESSLNPTVSPGDNGKSFGVAQWNGDRLNALQAFAAQQGGDWHNLDTQLGFVNNELGGSEGKAGQALRNAQTIQDATSAFAGYERPSGWTPSNPQGANAYDKRLQYAMQALSGGGASGIDAPGASSETTQTTMTRMGDPLMSAAQVTPSQQQNPIDAFSQLMGAQQRALTPITQQPQQQAAEPDTFDVQMPDGTIVQGVPKGTTQEELQGLLGKDSGASSKQTPWSGMINDTATPQQAADKNMRNLKSFGSGLAGAIPDLMTMPQRLIAGAEPWMEKLGLSPEVAKTLTNSDLVNNTPSATDAIRSYADSLAPTPNAPAGDMEDKIMSFLGSAATPMGLDKSVMDAGGAVASKVGRFFAPEGRILAKEGASLGNEEPIAADFYARPGEAPYAANAEPPRAAPQAEAAPTAQSATPEAQAVTRLTTDQKAGQKLIPELIGKTNNEEISSRLVEAQKLGQPMVAADVIASEKGGVLQNGKNTLGMIRALASLPGKTADLAGEIAARAAQASQRIGQALDKFISKNDYYGSITKAEEYKKGSNPFYQSAFKNNQSVQSTIINRILQTPSGKAALKEVAHDMGDEMTLLAKPDKELTQQAKDVGLVLKGGKGAGNGLKLQTLDRVKQKLDQLATQAYQAGDKSAGNRYAKLAKGLRGEADRLDVTAKAGPNSSKTEGGDYARGRALNATGQQMNEALENGRNFMKMDPEEIAAFMKDKNTSLPQKEAFAKGTRRWLEDKIDGKVGEKAPLGTLWTKAVQKRLQALGGSEEDFSKLTQFMENEKAMNRTDNALTGGSMTNPNANYQQMIGNNTGLSAGKIVGALHNPGGAAIDVGIHMLDKELVKRMSKASEETGYEVMRHLLAKDAKIWQSLPKPKKGK